MIMELDAAAMYQLILKLGLVAQGPLQECWDEVGNQLTNPEALLRALERKGHLGPYQTQKLRKGDTDGYFLGGYRLLYKIASGSFGRVFRADEPESGRMVAIKVLRRRWSEDPHVVDLFEREGKVGLSLRHPNIVEVLTVNQDPITKQYYIAMEFVEGGNLRDFLAIRKKLEPAEALRVLEDCVAGIAHSYSRGVTHRDIKLTNILISSQGAAKLVDFGLAGIFRTIGWREEDSKIDRTVDYAGREKTTGVKTGDVRSDIYFRGCVLHEMLSGRSPLAMSRDRHARMHRQRFEDVTPLRRDEVSAPAGVFHLVETMMSLNPEHRYQTPSQLLEAVREARREVEGRKHGTNNVAPATRSVFVVERDERLQDMVRRKFKELGYRVLLSADPIRALDRFRHHPFDALVVDAATTGQDGILLFERIVGEAEKRGMNCKGILMLSNEQSEWVHRIEPRPAVSVMVHPITLRQLSRKLQGLLPPS
jgi:CheY-like chemotaxis protein